MNKDAYYVRKLFPIKEEDFRNDGTSSRPFDIIDGEIDTYLRQLRRNPKEFISEFLTLLGDSEELIDWMSKRYYDHGPWRSEKLGREMTGNLYYYAMYMLGIDVASRVLGNHGLWIMHGMGGCDCFNWSGTADCVQKVLYTVKHKTEELHLNGFCFSNRDNISMLDHVVCHPHFCTIDSSTFNDYVLKWITMIHNKTNKEKIVKYLTKCTQLRDTYEEELKKVRVR